MKLKRAFMLGSVLLALIVLASVFIVYIRLYSDLAS